MSLPIVVIAISAFAIAFATWRSMARRSGKNVDAARLGLSGRPLLSAEQICRRAATRLKLDVLYLERSQGTVHPVAGVPWPAHLEILDIMAAEACLDSEEPSGIGSGQHGASDWLFIPLKKDGRTVAALGVAGPHCRRRFESDDAGIKSLRTNFERLLAERDAAPDLATSGALSTGAPKAGPLHPARGSAKPQRT